MQLFFHSPIKDNSFLLDKEESNHLIKVLRKSVGDKISFTDGEGNLYVCQIEELSLKKTLVKILEKEHILKAPYQINLAIAPTKNAERMEWMLEKAVEIGLNELILLKTSNSERNFLKAERLEKKAISALKQSLKYYKTEISQQSDFTAFLSDKKWNDYEKFIAYVDKDLTQHLFDLASRDKKYLILIGPEGDFTPQEISMAIEKGFKPCSLGPSRLRTETAGLVAVHSLNLKNSL